MERSWLIQRLESPRRGGILGDNPFAFGGGLKNGGLSDDAMGLIRDLWSFDYMGAAEFEFGAVPEALDKIAKRVNVSWSFEIPLADVPADWRDKSGDVPEGSATIYVISRLEDREEIERRIRGWATEQYNRDLKEMTRLSSTLRPHNEWDGDVVGWLELNNGFLFFTDKDMHDNAARLFGVEAS